MITGYLPLQGNKAAFPSHNAYSETFIQERRNGFAEIFCTSECAYTGNETARSWATPYYWEIRYNEN
jgi:hypothetical protein